LYLNPNNIIIPDKYDENPSSGYDIALIGLGDKDFLNLENYFMSLKDENVIKKPYFEDSNLDVFLKKC
jgi:hypothetical protein